MSRKDNRLSRRVRVELINGELCPVRLGVVPTPGGGWQVRLPGADTTKFFGAAAYDSRKQALVAATEWADERDPTGSLANSKARGVTLRLSHDEGCSVGEALAGLARYLERVSIAAEFDKSFAEPSEHVGRHDAGGLI